MISWVPFFKKKSDSLRESTAVSLGYIYSCQTGQLEGPVEYKIRAEPERQPY